MYILAQLPHRQAPEMQDAPASAQKQIRKGYSLSTDLADVSPALDTFIQQEFVKECESIIIINKLGFT
jgi:hypothetical protein